MYVNTCLCTAQCPLMIAMWLKHVEAHRTDVYCDGFCDTRAWTDKSYSLNTQTLWLSTELPLHHFPFPMCTWHVLNSAHCPSWQKYRSFATTVPRLKMCDLSAMTTQLLSSSQLCKLRYDTRPAKSASANISFYTNNSKMPYFELWHSCCKWVICSLCQLLLLSSLKFI
jgi:hypothetical protein